MKKKFKQGCVIFSLLSLVFFAECFGQQTRRKRVKRKEAPRETFHQDGGRTLKTKVIWGEAGELTAEGIAGQRDLSRYEQPAHFDCRSWSEAARSNPYGAHLQIQERTAQAREFIWQHWQNKQRGYLRITFNSVDAVGTSHIFIEPDAQGVWQIVWRIVRWHALITDEIDDFPILRAVEHTTNKSGEKLLSFKIASGKEWATL